MPAPTCDPNRRDPAKVVPASAYHRGDPVWVHRGTWRPGVVEGASNRAVLATYRYAEGRGTVVDTMSAEFVTVRRDVDAQLDGPNTLPLYRPNSLPRYRPNPLPRYGLNALPEVAA